MRKFILIVLFVAFFFIPSTAFSGYRIELKNGSIITTSNYWEVNNLIKFYAYGGIVGFDPQAIRSIEEVTLDILPQPVPSVAANKQPPQEKEEMLPGSKTRPKPSGAQADQKQASKSAKSQIQTEIEKQIDRLKKKSDKAWARFEELPESATRADRRAARNQAYEIDLKIAELAKKLRQLSVQPPVPPTQGID